MDNFYEQLVTTYKTVRYKSVGFVPYMAGVLALFMFMMGQFVTAIVLVLIGVGAFFYKRTLYVEYEYEFTNGEIDIDKILDMSKRKRVANFNARDIELMAAEDSSHLKNFPELPKKAITLYPTTSKEKVYSIVLNLKGEKVILKLVPDEQFINLCFKYNPRNVKKY